MREWAYVHAQIGALGTSCARCGSRWRAGPRRIRRNEMFPEQPYGPLRRDPPLGPAGILRTSPCSRRRTSTRRPRAARPCSSRARRSSARAPHWIAAAEMVKTSRLFARLAARIQPEWLEELGGELCKRATPTRATTGPAARPANERVTLFGLEIVPGAAWPSARRARRGPRDLRREGLVEGEAKEPPISSRRIWPSSAGSRPRRSCGGATSWWPRARSPSSIGEARGDPRRPGPAQAAQGRARPRGRGLLPGHDRGRSSTTGPRRRS